MMIEKRKNIIFLCYLGTFLMLFEYLFIFLFNGLRIMFGPKIIFVSNARNTIKCHNNFKISDIA